MNPTGTTTSTPAPRRRGPRRLTGLLALAVALSVAPATMGVATAAPPQPVNATQPDLGVNVTVFDPSTPLAQIQAKADAIYAQQVANEMGTQRYALLFKPGTYGTATQPLQIKVGYYTEVAGLGASPRDVTINGKVEVYNRCRPNADGTNNCIALDNFWRSVSNFHLNINAAGQDGCRGTANFFAVSQASPMRRVEVSGGTLSLMDYCTDGPQYASGGFIADTLAGTVVNGSQQQWLTRNSTIGSWSNGVWNQVFSGVEGAPSEASFPDPPYTTVEKTPVSREKPYLFVDAKGAYQVRVPSAQKDSRGVSWANGLTAGRTVPLTDFFIAKPTTSVQEINAQLARGKDLLLTPGVYDVAQSIAVKRADTVVLGLGLATLTAVDGAVPMTVADVPGVVVAGVTIDAGTKESPVLLEVGKKNGNNSPKKSGATNPTTLSDVFFRVGGPHVGKADTALVVNSDHVLVDHTWVWRADHGVEGFTNGYLGDTDRWRTNTGRTGVVVNGDDVTATGLFVEHFQQHSTVWNGERGRVVLYQNEIPYDPPSQADWKEPNGTLGWAGYKVGDNVKTHRLDGGGVYGYQRNAAPGITTAMGFEVPTTPGVQLHHVMTVHLDGIGVIQHVVNGVGAQADSSNGGKPRYLADYPVR
ncbi:glycoside hydrolase family 55 protein [Modestobacter sp. L9-4]|uniref:glycoside hydrolase family 55 protein n=1 Tax=Modestobacter sp. L9-4 TaxID=2851567 RepID=UPI001C7919D7|nr:glycoside hydrolase family 55 protein [Modestobacter sp. L9-4]QXG75431.1 glycoside hydrolase family 55 protein [Modestobacter sp. L9-4]